MPRVGQCVGDALTAQHGLSEQHPDRHDDNRELPSSEKNSREGDTGDERGDPATGECDRKPPASCRGSANDN